MTDKEIEFQHFMVCLFHRKDRRDAPCICDPYPVITEDFLTQIVSNALKKRSNYEEN
jgi:hypothetical protein